jgi:hypothetical protein
LRCCCCCGAVRPELVERIAPLHDGSNFPSFRMERCCPVLLRSDRSGAVVGAVLLLLQCGVIGRCRGAVAVAVRSDSHWGASQLDQVGIPTGVTHQESRPSDSPGKSPLSRSSAPWPCRNPPRLSTSVVTHPACPVDRDLPRLFNSAVADLASVDRPRTSPV